MKNITIAEREITQSEYAGMMAGFDEHTEEHDNPVETAERFSFVVMANDRFIGCSSGLAYKSDCGYNKWFFITDLFIESSYRRQGLGGAVLKKLEERASALGIKKMWTWTAGFEGPDFYRKKGYGVFYEQDDWYASGHSRFGFLKVLSRKS